MSLSRGIARVATFVRVFSWVTGILPLLAFFALVGSRPEVHVFCILAAVWIALGESIAWVIGGFARGQS